MAEEKRSKKSKSKKKAESEGELESTLPMEVDAVAPSKTEDSTVDISNAALAASEPVEESADADEKSELAVDVSAEAPLSRKQRRLKKKEDALAKGAEADAGKAAAIPEKPKRSEHSLWIGNLRYSADKKTLKTFFAKCGTPSRIHMPQTSPGVNRGFAYVDFATAEELQAALALTETGLDGRSVLIKDARDFTKKTPLKEPEAVTGGPLRGNQRHRQTNPPAATLFVGNLPFEATKDELHKLFSAFGKLRKVRFMTFEDSGKCKGFSYVDFMELEDAKKAVESPQSHYLQSRRLRVEYGSTVAVQRGTPWIHDPKGLHRKRENPETAEADTTENKEETSGAAETETRPTRRRRRNVDAPPLAPPAPTRGPVAAVPFQGSKMTFDDNDD